MATDRELTPQEDLFLEYLFDGDKIRHPNEAKLMAGYAKDYPLTKIMKRVNSELITRCDNALTMYAPKAIMGLLSIIQEPTEPGAKIKLSAIQDFLNRAGVVAKDKTEVTQAAQNFLFVLPAKETIETNN